MWKYIGGKNTDAQDSALQARYVASSKTRWIVARPGSDKRFGSVFALPTARAAAEAAHAREIDEETGEWRPLTDEEVTRWVTAL